MTACCSKVYDLAIDAPEYDLVANAPIMLLPIVSIQCDLAVPTLRYDLALELPVIFVCAADLAPVTDGLMDATDVLEDGYDVFEAA